MISPDELRAILALQREEGLSFYEAVEKRGSLNEKKLKFLQATVEQSRIRLGEILVKRGLISREELEDAFKEFSEKI